MKAHTLAVLVGGVMMCGLVACGRQPVPVHHANVESPAPDDAALAMPRFDRIPPNQVLVTIAYGRAGDGSLSPRRAVLWSYYQVQIDDTQVKDFTIDTREDQGITRAGGFVAQMSIYEGADWPDRVCIKGHYAWEQSVQPARGEMIKGDKTFVYPMAQVQKWEYDDPQYHLCMLGHWLKLGGSSTNPLHTDQRMAAYGFVYYVRVDRGPKVPRAEVSPAGH